MNNNSTIQKQSVIYAFDKSEDKHFFAGLLNMAELNLAIALQETLIRTIRNKKTNDNTKVLIQQLFTEDIMQSDWNYRVEVLSEFLPVIKALQPHADKATFINTLTLFAETLNTLRNFYTHHFHPPIEIDPRLFEILDTILLHSALYVKKQRLKTDDGKAIFPKQYEDDLRTKLAIHNEEVKQKRISELSKPENKNIPKRQFDKIFNRKNKIYTEAEFVNTYLNGVFHNLLYKDKKNEGLDQLNADATSKKKDRNYLSKNGFVLFLSFFLDKKNLEDLFSRTENFRGTHELRFMVTRWVFSLHAFRDVRRVLRSDYSNDALLLQMIGELNKCPKELFNVLSTEHQLEFFEDLNEYYSNSQDGDKPHADSLVTHTVWRKRYDDKFSYFALRFLDEFAGFTNLKFQVVVGNYVHDSRTKELVGINKVTDRTIKEKIKAFGKLSEVDRLKKEYFLKKNHEQQVSDPATETNELSESWEEYPVAHYKLDNNNIPIYLSIPGFQKDSTPKEFRTKRLNKKSILEQLTTTGFIESEPIAFLSVNELPALLYQLLFNHKSAAQIETMLIQKITSQVSEIKRFNTESTIDKHKIPKRLIQLASTNATPTSINFVKLLKDINSEIDTCDSRLKETDDNLNKSKYRRFNNEQRGKVATWLADDIKRFAGKDIRSKKWKSHLHGELQALLAFYTERKVDIQVLLEKELGLSLDKNKLIPTSFSEDTLEKFYIKYLETRREILTGFKASVDKTKNEYPNSLDISAIEHLFNIFDKRLYVSSHIEKYKSDLLQKPLNLPRGIFDAATYSPVQKGDKSNFQPWFEVAAKTEQYQEFYNFPRKYETIELNPVSGKGLLEQNDNKPVDPDVFKNEKRLREIARQDFYVLEMAKHMIRHMYPAIRTSQNYTLKDVFKTKHEKEQIKRRAAQQSQKKAGSGGEHFIDDSHLLLRRFPVTVAIGNKKIVDYVALKDIGKFRRLEKDNRIKLLLSYSEQEIWTVKEIEDEITNYEDVRKEAFFNEVHVFEQEVLQKVKLKAEIDTHPEILEQNGYPNFKHYVAYHFFNNDTITFDKFVKVDFQNEKSRKEIVESNNILLLKAYFLVLIRNKFSHNQLPEKVDFLKMNAYIKFSGEKIGDYLLHFFKESIV